MSDHVELSIQQFVDAWDILCAAAPGYLRRSETGIEYVFSGVPISFFNAAVLTGRGLTANSLQVLGEQARARADEQGISWILVVTEEAIQPGTDYVASLDACGYAHLMQLTGMLAQHVASAERIPEGLELTIAADDTACTAIMDVNSAAYAIPFEAANDVWGRAAFWKDHVGVLGLVERKPVSSTAVMKVAGHRYVALVATAPGQQRRGYADATMRHALEVSREANGELPTFLHASEAGRPVYERMGYETVARHQIFMDKKFLGEH